MTDLTWFLLAICLIEFALLLYSDGVIKSMAQDLKALSNQNNRIVKCLAPSMTKLNEVIRRIMNHKYEPRDNKHTVASARNAYAKEILGLFGFEDVK